jgi:hypothetical protein
MRHYKMASGISALFYSKAPRARAQRNLLMRFIIFILGWILIGVCAGVFQAFFDKHQLLGAVALLLAIATLYPLVLAWRHRVSCPRCGWNINLKKTEFGSPGRNYFLIPARCPNCSEHLDLEPP